jgi:hypothetical protein
MSSDLYVVFDAELTDVAQAIREKGGTTEELVFPEGFINAIHNISGGAGVSVITAASASELPETANQFTIALITETPISNVYIQSTIPEFTNNGDIIMLTSKAERYINLFESGGNFEVGVCGAYISNTGVWDFVDTYIFIDGAWVFLWSAQLYYNNNEYESYTGGWISEGKKSTSDTGASATTKPTIIKNYEGTKIRTSMGGSVAQGGIFYLSQPIDLTPYKTIVFEGVFQCSGAASRNLTAAVWSSIGSYYEANKLAFKYVPEGTEVNLIEIDVTTIDRTGYIGFGLTGTTASNKFGGVTSVTLEKAYLIPKEM